MRTAYNSLAAIIGAAALWLGATTTPVAAEVVTYDLVYASSPGVSLTGSITFDDSCSDTCPVISFSTHFDTGFTSYDFDGLVPDQPSIVPQILLTGGVPTGLIVEDGAEGPGPDDFVFFLLFQNAWGVNGVIDGFEFHEVNTVSFVLDTPTESVPEPATALLLGAGLAAFGWSRRST